METKFATARARVETVEERNKRAVRYSGKCARRRQTRAQVRTARLLGISAAVFFFALALKLGTMI